MVDILFNELYQMYTDGTLVPNEEYRITDYSAVVVPIVTATDEKTLAAEGTTDDGDIILFSLDGEMCSWTSMTGYIYYLEDTDGNRAWFDFKTEDLIADCSNVEILPYYDADGKFVIPTVKLSSCTNVVVGGSTDLDITNSNEIIIGTGNTGEVTGCTYITIGDNNTNIMINTVNGAYIGDGNDGITLQNVDDIHIGSRNISVEISDDFNIVASDSMNITVSASSNQVLNKCNKINVTSLYNRVDNTKYGDIASDFNKVDKCDSISLETSVGNDLQRSRLVHLEGVNNNEIYIDNLSILAENTPNPEPFMRIRPAAKKGIKIAERILEPISLQPDNGGTILDTYTNTLRNVSTKGHTVYVMDDGVWTTTPQELKYYTVDISKLSNTDTLYILVTGAGEYQENTTCTLTATMLEGATFNYWVDLSNGDIVSNNTTYSFTVTTNKTFQPVYTKPA